jgi:hypothetical protein
METNTTAKAYRDIERNLAGALLKKHASARNCGGCTFPCVAKLSFRAFSRTNKGYKYIYIEPSNFADILMTLQ